LFRDGLVDLVSGKEVIYNTDTILQGEGPNVLGLHLKNVKKVADDRDW
jgi:hypothetical protein